MPNSVIASEAKQSICPQRRRGLLRRCAPLRKRFAFVAGNDGGGSVGWAKAHFAPCPPSFRDRQRQWWARCALPTLQFAATIFIITAEDQRRPRCASGLNARASRRDSPSTSISRSSAACHATASAP